MQRTGARIPSGQRSHSSCGACAKPRGIKDEDLIEGARIVTAANVVEFMTSGAATLNF